jgi:hypothetical protein
MRNRNRQAGSDAQTALVRGNANGNSILGTVTGNQLTFNPAIAKSTASVKKTFAEIAGPSGAAQQYITTGASWTLCFADGEGAVNIPAGSYVIGPNCTWLGQDTSIITTDADAVSFDFGPITWSHLLFESNATTPLFATLPTPTFAPILTFDNVFLLSTTAPIYSFGALSTVTQSIIFLRGGSEFINAGAPIFKTRAVTAPPLLQFYLYDGATGFAIGANTIDANAAWNVLLFESNQTVSASQVTNAPTVFLQDSASLVTYTDTAPVLGTTVAGTAITFLKKGATTSGGALAIVGNAIAPTSMVHQVGVGLIKNITLQAGFQSEILFINPTAAFTYDATGNIAIPTGGTATAVVNKLMIFAWDATAAKWIPNY